MRDVNDPVSGPVALTPSALGKHRLLIDLSYPNVVEFPPSALLMVFDQSVVVPTLCTSIVDTDCMELVLVLRKVLVHAFEVFLLSLDLAFQLLNLLKFIGFHRL